MQAPRGDPTRGRVTVSDPMEQGGAAARDLLAAKRDSDFARVSGPLTGAALKRATPYTLLVGLRPSLREPPRDATGPA